MLSDRRVDDASGAGPADSEVDDVHAVATLTSGEAVLGIELGSTRIKAVLVGPDHSPLATGAAAWENAYVDRTWTYSLDDVWTGVQAAVGEVLADAEARYGVRPTTFAAMGVSGMMHGYLALDRAGRLLVPFRTWRNTSPGPAAELLTERLGVNIPVRWSVAHLVQAVLDGEPHVREIASLTTLAGYVHRRLTGRHVLGVGDASGMFPIDASTRTYDVDGLACVEEILAGHGVALRLADVLPEPLVAGERAGTLTPEGAALLDPSGGLLPGVVLCPPEGDAGTGMVATGAVAPRTGNVSVGTSIFAMVVLERPLERVHLEIDLVATPAGDDVAMVHCNNGASELGAWAGVFGEAVTRLGVETSPDVMFGALLGAALDGEPDAGGVLAYNTLSGEPVSGLDDARPLVVRTPESRFTLANLMRAQVYGIFATLHVGMRALADEGVQVDVMQAHGGVFRTAGVAQRFCAAAVGAPVAVSETASEGGAWGMALLASYAVRAGGRSLEDFLEQGVFAGRSVSVIAPAAEDVEGFRRYVAAHEAGLAVVRVAAEAVR